MSKWEKHLHVTEMEKELLIDWLGDLFVRQAKRYADKNARSIIGHLNENCLKRTDALNIRYSGTCEIKLTGKEIAATLKELKQGKTPSFPVTFTNDIVLPGAADASD